MEKGTKNKTLKRCVIAVAVTLLLIILLPFTLYIPFVQSIVKDYVAEKVSEATGWDVSIGAFHLKFPLAVDIADVQVLDANRDTMLLARQLTADVELLPLLDKQINVRKASLREGFYRMVTEDSALTLRAKLQSCDVADARIDLGRNDVAVAEATAADGDVTLHYDPTRKKPSDDTTSEYWTIEAGKALLSNVRYRMDLLPVIDSLDAVIGNASALNCKVDTRRCTVDCDDLTVDGLKAAYFYPSEQWLAEHPEVAFPVDTIAKKQPSPDWVVKGRHVQLRNGSGLYAMRGAKPAKGFDPYYISGDSLHFDITDFFNKASDVKLAINTIGGRERCGLEVTSGHGIVTIDSTAVTLDKLTMATRRSKLTAQGTVPYDIMAANPAKALDLVASASVSPDEVVMFAPAAGDYTRYLPSRSNIDLDLDINGSMADALVRKGRIDIPGMARLAIDGTFSNILAANRRARLNIDGNIGQLNQAKGLFLDRTTAEQVNLPPMAAKGNIVIDGNSYAGRLTATTGAGRMALDGSVNLNSERYDVNVKTDNFPIQSILPKSQLGNVTGHFAARGAGFNPLANGVATDADVNLSSITFNGREYRDVTLNGRIVDGRLTARANSQNEALDLALDIQSSIANDYYDYSVDGRINDLDLQRLGFSDVPFDIRMGLSSMGTIDLRNSYYDVTAALSNVDVTYDQQRYVSEAATATLLASPDTVKASINEGDLTADAHFSCSLDTLLSRSSLLAGILNRQIEKRWLNFAEINDALPRFDLMARMGGNNLLSEFLRGSDMGVRNLNLTASKDSLLNLSGRALGLKTPSFTLDTVVIDAHQQGSDLNYAIHLGNKKGNLDDFAVTDLSGSLGNNSIKALVQQANRKGVTGFDFGVNAFINGDILSLNLFPENAIIGYKSWRINPDNYINYDIQRFQLDGNLNIENDNGYLSIASEPNPDSIRNDLHINIDDVNLAEWLSLSPLSPAIKGKLSATSTITSGDGLYIGSGTIGLGGITYGSAYLGNFDLNLNINYDPASGNNTAQAILVADDIEALTVTGSLNGKATHIDAIAEHFPLRVVNPFLPEGTVQLDGYLNGDLDLTGSIDEPSIKGFIKADSAEVILPTFGSHLNIDTTRLNIDGNSFFFRDFALYGANGNPLSVNGSFSLKNLSPYLDLSFEGNNVQIIDSKQRKESMIFGSGFANLRGAVKGRVSRLNVDANVTVLPTTNVTYVMSDDVTTLSQTSADGLVEFVQFNKPEGEDEAADAQAKHVESFGMNITAPINVQRGSIINVFLDPSGKDIVQISGNGNLTYTQNFIGDRRLQGRYSVNSGFVKYHPPLISEKFFTLTPGSYVSFSGDMSNPTLDLHATSNQAAMVVTDSSNPTRVNFIISASVKNSLSNMAVGFDLAADNNSYVQSELTAMTPQQRSAQAINLMLHGTYSSQTSSTAAAGNANLLYSVLSSQINKFASKAFKGVDISFGISQYNDNSGLYSSRGMNYSYQISKSFFNDRFKMTVGGFYDTSASTDATIAENLFSNVAFEYALNQRGTMFVKLYNKLSDNNIYRQQVNVTGASFVIRRKLSNLRNLFRFNFRRKPAATETPAPSTTVTTNADGVTVISPNTPENESK